MKHPALAILLLMLAAWSPLRAQDITVAAAADLTYCLPVIDTAFEKAFPSAHIKATFGSSGNFCTQIKNGAPFDVFLSADLQYPEALQKDGLAGLPARYAQGRLVLWTVNPAIDVSKGLAILGDPAVRRIAIANPDHAPYGRAAKAALQKAALWDTLQPKLVFGENIAQTAQFVQTGNAEAGFVAYSLVAAQPADRAGHSFELPADQYPPIDQAACVTKSGESKSLAKAYVDFLKGPDARKILDQYGFRLPKMTD
jgi:molybdate transport system substrate-binding protein